MSEQWQQVQTVAETWSPEQVLRWAYGTFQQDIAMASGFGAEGMVLIDMASRLNPDFRVFTLDTEFLFSETYELIDRVEKRYGIKVERVYSTLTPEDQAGLYGAALWSRNPDQCCRLRKVEPLKNKLAELRAWVAAIRRDQTPTRAMARKVEWDAKFQLVKINPLASWTSEKVWSYIRQHKLPYNPLHDQNYPSVGCTHCTRAVLSGENPRAGRWSGFNKSECGLHTNNVEPVATLVGIAASCEANET